MEQEGVADITPNEVNEVVDDEETNQDSSNTGEAVVHSENGEAKPPALPSPTTPASKTENSTLAALAEKKKLLSQAKADMAQLQQDLRKLSLVRNFA